MAKRIGLSQEDLINTILRSKGTSQVWLGKQIGRKQTAINNTIKRGNMTVDMFYTIMNALGYDVVVCDRYSKAEYTVVGQDMTVKGDLEK